MDILNIETQINQVAKETNRELLLTILSEFKRKHYPNVLDKVRLIRSNSPIDEQLSETLSIIEIVSHSELNEYRAASKIILSLYESKGKTTDQLLLYGELAYMCDQKLARRILSDVVKRMEVDDKIDRIKTGRGYLLLGETEEQLEKLIRAIKYYKKGLEYFHGEGSSDNYMIMYLHFKIGMIYTRLSYADEAIEFLKKSIDLADANGQEDMKINSLVSIGKNYSTKEAGEKALPYLHEALNLIKDSHLKYSLTHADALTEVGFNYFDRSENSNAVPYYEEAIRIYEESTYPPSRKLGMILMQFAFCLANKEQKEISKAVRYYEKAIEWLEKAKDQQLLENALADVIAFFEQTNNYRKKRMYENKYVKMVSWETSTR